MKNLMGKNRRVFPKAQQHPLRVLFSLRDIKKKDTRRVSSFVGAGDRTRTGTLSPAADFESSKPFGRL